MYTFLNHLQVTESERLMARNIKLKENPLNSIMDRALGQKSRPKVKNKKGAIDSSDESEEEERQLPIGYDYSDNFP